MKYISVAQACKKLGVSRETIYNYCKRGLLGGQYIKINTRGTWKVDAESVELLLESGKFKSILQIKKEQQYSLF